MRVLVHVCHIVQSKQIRWCALKEQCVTADFEMFFSATIGHSAYDVVVLVLDLL